MEKKNIWLHKGHHGGDDNNGFHSQRVKVYESRRNK